MDKTTHSQSKKSGNRPPPSPPSRTGVPFWLVHFVLGLVLIAAGALKLHEFAFESQDESAATLLLMVFAEIELVGGIWLAGCFDPGRTAWWAAAGFLGLACASFFEAMAGKCSCGCFGGVSINPWFVLLFDLAAAAALLASRPRGGPDAVFPSHPAQWLALGAIALTVAAAGWRQADLVTVEGQATVDGRPLDEAAITFTGGSGKIALRTDHDGGFRLPLVRPGLYAVSAPGRAMVLSTEQPKPIDRGARSRKPARRPPSGTASPPPHGLGDAVVWIEVPICSEKGRAIEINSRQP